MHQDNYPMNGKWSDDLYLFFHFLWENKTRISYKFVWQFDYVVERKRKYKYISWVLIFRSEKKRRNPKYPLNTFTKEEKWWVCYAPVICIHARLPPPPLPPHTHTHTYGEGREQRLSQNQSPAKTSALLGQKRSYSPTVSPHPSRT